MVRPMRPHPPHNCTPAAPQQASPTSRAPSPFPASAARPAAAAPSSSRRHNSAAERAAASRSGLASRPALPPPMRAGVLSHLLQLLLAPAPTQQQSDMGERGAPSLDAQQLAVVLSTLARVKADPSTAPASEAQGAAACFGPAVEQALLASLAAGEFACLAGAAPASVAHVTLALAQLRWGDSALWQALTSAAERTLPVMEPQVGPAGACKPGVQMPALWFCNEAGAGCSARFPPDVLVAWWTRGQAITRHVAAHRAPTMVSPPHPSPPAELLPRPVAQPAPFAPLSPGCSYRHQVIALRGCSQGCTTSHVSLNTMLQPNLAV